MLMLKLMPNKYSGNLKVLTFKAVFYDKKNYMILQFIYSMAVPMYTCVAPPVSPLRRDRQCPLSSHIVTFRKHSIL